MLNDKKLKITCPSFENNGMIPKKHTGFGEDISPAFKIENMYEDAVSIAITMDDLDVPFSNEYNHWCIWNIPKTNEITENIPYGKTVPILGNAMQGVGYGKNRYRWPKQPIFVRNVHRYIFRFFILDTFIDLDSNSNKNDLIEAMKGHILQEGSIIGKYKR